MNPVYLTNFQEITYPVVQDILPCQIQELSRICKERTQDQL